MKKYLYLLTVVMMMLIPMGVSASTQSDYVDTKTRQIVSELGIKDADDYTKVCAINDYMFEHFKFVQTKTNDSAYTLLNKGESNCQGFCQLFIELAKKVNLESAMVYQDYMGHRWNVVKMDDGKYYFVDVATNRYMNSKRMYTLKGTKGFFYTMDSSFKYDVPETEYKYVPKVEEPKEETVIIPNEPTTEKKEETKPSDIIAEEEPTKPTTEVKPETKPVVKPETPTTEQKPQTTPVVKPSNPISGGTNAGVTNHLFSFSTSVPNFGSALKAAYNFGANTLSNLFK